MGKVHSWTRGKLGLLATLLVVAAAGAALLVAAPATANAKKKTPIRIGILEPALDTTGNAAMLKDIIVMLIEEQNRKGGLLERKLEAVAVSPTSLPQAQAEAAQELLNRDHVSVIFSANLDESGPDVQKLFAGSNALLFDSAPTSGDDSPPKVLHTGAAPNQQALPAVDYLASGKGVERWVLLGTDGKWPGATNRIIEAELKARGVPARNILIIDTPPDISDWSGILADIRAFAGHGDKTAVISTLMGDQANNGFYKALAAQGLSGQMAEAAPQAVPADATPAPLAAPAPPATSAGTSNRLIVLSLSLGEEDLTRLDWRAMTGTLIAGNYVTSSPTPDNKAFLERWRAFSKDPERLASDRVEAHRLGFSIWAKAVAKAGTTDAAPVADAMTNIRQLSLTGDIVQMLPNRHITRAAFIGEVNDEGTLTQVWKSPGLIAGASWAELRKEMATPESAAPAGKSTANTQSDDVNTAPQ